jgi:hypothetical protein
MKTKIQLIAIAILFFTNQNIFGQVTTPANAAALLTDYVGWNMNPGNPALNIKHEQALPINFYTNAGLFLFNNPRMQIFENGGPPNSGHIAIGDFTTFQPQSLMHLHEAAPGVSLPVYTQWTNSAEQPLKSSQNKTLKQIQLSFALT